MAFGSLRVLRSRDYALVWWSGLISNAGTWMQAVAVGALVTGLTHKASWGGFTAAVSFFASGIVTPLGGVLADRHNRRRLLLGVTVAEAVVAFILAALYLSGDVSPAVLVVNVAIEGCLVAIAMPAQSAMMPDLVPKENLVDAAALGNASWNLGRTLGPALGGLIIAVGSYTWVFVINAVTFLAVSIAIFFVRIPPVAEPTDESVWVRLRQGFSGARNEAGCWAAIRMIAIVALFVSPFIALMPAMAQIVFHGTAVDTSHFVIAQGVGAVFGAFALGPLAKRYGRRRMIMAALILLPLVEMAYSQAPTKAWGIAGAFGLGASYVGALVGMNVVVQLRAAVKLRARTLAVYFMTLSLFYPVGATIQGWLGDQIGLRKVLFLGPAIFLIVLALMALLRPQWLRALDVTVEKQPQALVDVGEATP